MECLIENQKERQEKTGKMSGQEITTGGIPHDMPKISKYMSDRVTPDMPDNVKIDVRRHLRIHVR